MPQEDPRLKVASVVDTIKTTVDCLAKGVHATTTPNRALSGRCEAFPLTLQVTTHHGSESDPEPGECHDDNRKSHIHLFSSRHFLHPVHLPSGKRLR